MGLNVGGWPFNSRNTRVEAIIRLLNNHRPDILIILESHLNDSITALSFHDDYEILLNNPSIGLDVGHSRGRGILFLGRWGLTLNKIFPNFNHSRQAVALVQYDNNKLLVLAAFHLDQVHKQYEVHKLSLLLADIQNKYSGSDFCLFSDLNLHPEDKCF